MSTKLKKTKRKTARINPVPFFIIAVILELFLTIYIANKASTSFRELFPASLIALFAGLIFESFRVSGSWKTVVRIFLGTYLFSLITFLPGKVERVHSFESKIEAWPYYFILFFAFFFGITHKKKVTSKLTEGTALLLSISFIYWAVDYGFTDLHDWFSNSLMIIGLLFSTFSIVNALTHIQLSTTNRLTLSIWSTIIMSAFAIDNIIRVFKSPDIDNLFLSEGLYIGVQYFLLGVSAVYIIQNFMLLAPFLPRRISEYKHELEKVKKDHINRFSDKQVLIRHSILCILYTVTLYVLNYNYQVLPRHTMIWLVFLTFPFLLRQFDSKTYGGQHQ